MKAKKLPATSIERFLVGQIFDLFEIKRHRCVGTLNKTKEVKKAGETVFVHFYETNAVKTTLGAFQS